jgi:hypothetical protein
MKTDVCFILYYKYGQDFTARNGTLIFPDVLFRRPATVTATTTIHRDKIL